MGDIEWKIAVADQERKELLIAQLYDLGVQGMEETHDGLNVYASDESVNQEDINKLLKQNDFTPFHSSGVQLLLLLSRQGNVYFQLRFPLRP